MRVNTTQAAAFLGVAPITLKRWRKEERGPVYYRRGRFVEYDTKDLEAYIKRVEPAAA